MNLLKKILIHILIIIIILMSCFSIYFANKHGLNIYAAVNDDAIYVPLRSQSDAVKAFQSYCKSRDLTIEGSLTDAVTTFTTGAFNSACNEIGIDITELQAEIKAEYDASGKPVKFLFNDTGVMAMNRIFAQFLQDNELEVGDSANQNDNTVYNGYLIVDDDNNTALAFVLNSGMSSANKVTSNVNNIVQEGTPIKYDVSDLKRLANNGNTSFTINYRNNHYNFPLGKTDGGIIYFTSTYFPNILSSSVYCPSTYGDYTNIKGEGYPCFIITPDNRLNLCYMSRFSASDGSRTYYWYKQERIQGFSADNLQSANVYITTFNTVINNNNYEGDTIINNEGDVINNNPNIPYNPYPDGGGPTTPSTGIGDGNGTQLTLPDLDLNLPSINWSIGDLTEKFPFSIPFDLIAFLTILNAEPETPEIQGTLNLAIVNWEFDYDLHQFDDLASLLRNLEFIGFCIGLVLITRSLLR